MPEDRASQIRDALGVDGTKTTATGGQLQDVLADTDSLDSTKITTARANNLDEITSVRLAELDAANLPADVDSILSTGGPGPWTTGSGGLVDWTAAEREQIRDSLGVDGTKTPATGGQVQAILADTDSLDTTKITPARAANLDEITAARLSELDAANLPADIDTLLGRLTAARALLLDNLSALDAAAVPADVTAVLARVDFELVRIHQHLGLLIGTPAVHTPSSIVAGTLSTTIGIAGSTITKTTTT